MTPRAMNARLHDDEWPLYRMDDASPRIRINFFEAFSLFFFFFFLRRGTNLEFCSNLFSLGLFQVSWTIILLEDEFLFDTVILIC